MKIHLIVSLVLIALVVGCTSPQETQEEDTQQQAQSQTETQLVDCGTSTTPISMEAVDSYTGDAASICFGNQIAKGCAESKVVINQDDEVVELQTMGNDANGACQIKYTIKGDNPNSGLANDCIYAMEELNGGPLSTVDTDTKKAQLTEGIYIASSFDILTGHFCKGELTDAVKSQLRQ